MQLAGLCVAALAFVAANSWAQAPLERGKYLVEGILTCGNCHTPRGPGGVLDIAQRHAGGPQVWETAIACARPGATVNLFGGCPRDTTITVNTEQLHYSELTLKGVFHNTPFYVREALDLLASRALPFELMISDRQPLKNLEQVFYDMRDRKVIKVAMEPDLV